MRGKRSKRKKSSNTSCSDLDLDSSVNINSSLTEESEQVDNSAEPEGAKSLPITTETPRQQKKKQRVNMESTLEGKLDSINEKLKNILTKDDREFIRNIIKDTVEEMKENLLASVNKKIESLEHEIHSTATKTDQFQEKLDEVKKDLEDQIEHAGEVVGNQTEKLRAENLRLKEATNELEQYSRRNNVRIVGIQHDSEKQSAAETTQLVTKTLNEHFGLDIRQEDIDITHRI